MKHLVPMGLRYRLMELRGRDVYSGYPDEYRCVFIHVPKTAGTSVVQSLFGKQSRHIHWSEYYRTNRHKFLNYFKFAFVRNPWDRLLSAYLFLKRGGMNRADHDWARRNLRGFVTFDQFVKGWVTEQNIWSWVHFLPQHYWICDAKLNCKMDFVGRIESISSDFGTVADQLGLTVRLSTMNRTRSQHYSRHYTEASREIVARVYADDIRLFDYRFERGRASAVGAP